MIYMVVVAMMYLNLLTEMVLTESETLKKEKIELILISINLEFLTTARI